jgi:hypothetical protein
MLNWFQYAQIQGVAVVFASLKKINHAEVEVLLNCAIIGLFQAYTSSFWVGLLVPIQTFQAESIATRVCPLVLS